MNSSDKIIDKIREENIKPAPKWHFKSLNWALYCLYCLFLIVGAVSFSIILFSIQQADFLLLEHLGHSKLEFFLVIFPFIWLITLIILLFGSFYAIYNSKKGYKFSFSKLMLFNMGFSILIGTLFFIAGGSSWFENTFSSGSGLFASIEVKKQKLWLKPDEGSLAGEIDSLNNTILFLEDFKKNIWIVSYDSSFIAPAITLEKEEKIKIIGKRTGRNTFTAERIMPWGGRGMREKRHRQWEKNNSEQSN